MSKIEIYCSDCLEFVKQLPDNCIDLIVTDPPYVLIDEEWDRRDIFNDLLISECFRVLKEEGSIYVWCSIGGEDPSLFRWFPLLNKYFYYQDLITWKKQRGRGNRKGWLYTREEIMWFTKNKKEYIWNIEEQYSKTELRKIEKLFTGKEAKSKFKRLNNVWTDIKENNIVGSKNPVFFHATSKPTEAMERIILLHTKEDDIVLDPFLGSGTTAVACKSLNRNFIGCDISPDFVKLAKERLNHE